MPYSAGIFSRIYNWVNEQLSSPIEISKLDAQEEDFATALNNCVLRDGTGLPTAAIDWNGQNLTGVAALTATGIVTGGRFVPTSSSVPTNGMYLSAANTLALSSNTTLRWSVNSTGTHTLAVPSSGSTLVVPGLTGTAAAYIGVLGSTNNPRVEITGTEASALAQIDFTGSTGSAAGRISRAGTAVIDISSGRNVSIAAPGSATALTVNGLTGTATLSLSSTGAASALNAGWSIGLFSSFYNMYTSSTDGLCVGTAGAAEYRVATNSATRYQISSAGAHTISAPSSGAALTVNGVAGTYVGYFNGGNSASSYIRIANAGTTVADLGSAAAVISGGASTDLGLSANTGAGLVLGTNGGAARLSIASGGATTLAAPSSGVGLTIAGGGLTVTGTITGDGSGLTTLNASNLSSGTVPDARFPATLPALSGVNLTALNATNLASGTVNTARISGSYTGITAIGNSTVNDSGGSPFDIGFRDLPQSTNTSLVLTDRGKHVLLSGTTNTVTIPANGSVAFPVGSTIVLVNSGSGNTTLNITTDTLTWYQGGATSTGSRTIATASVVTLLKVASTSWIITGSGIS